MTQANEHDYTRDRVRRGPGLGAPDLGDEARAPAARRAGRTRIARALRAVRHPDGRPGNARGAWRHDAGRARRAREGAAALHDEGHRRSRAARFGRPGRAFHGQAPGDAHGERHRPGAGVPVAAGQGGLAGQAAAGADPGRTGEAARGSAHPGEAQSVLTGLLQRTFGSLHTRNFRLFATGQVISNTGTWMQRVAQDWLILELTHGSGTAVGIATGLQFLTLLLFSLWGGMIADRYPKRNVLMVTQSVMGALAVILGVLAVTGVVQPWHVYLLAFGLGMATVVDNPTRQSFAIEMVGKPDLPNAIALNSAVFNLARILGPAVAGLVIAIVGTPTAFFINAASYLAVLISLKLMRPSALHPTARVVRAKGQLREGLEYVRSRPDLLMTLVLIFFVSTFGMNFQVTTALM